MELRELRYFTAVYEERNLTAAARRCFISQPSVSGAIAAIEADLGTRLFVRHKRGVSPTSSADALYPRAKRLLSDAAATRALFKGEAREESFTIGLLRSLDIARTIALLAPIAQMPGIRLRLVGADDPADARIIERAMKAETETLLPLWRERFVLALPACHPLAVPGPIKDAELRGLPLIARCHCETAALARGGNLGLKTVAVAESEEWALALVAAGIGVTILPEGSVGESKDVVIRPLAAHKISRVVGIAYGRKHALSSRGSEVIARLKAGGRQRYTGAVSVRR